MSRTSKAERQRIEAGDRDPELRNLLAAAGFLDPVNESVRIVRDGARKLYIERFHHGVLPREWKDVR